MALEVDEKLELETLRRQYFTLLLKIRAREVEESMTDVERADLVDALVLFWGETTDDLIFAAIDREFAEEVDDADPGAGAPDNG